VLNKPRVAVVELFLGEITVIGRTTHEPVGVVNVKGVEVCVTHDLVYMLTETFSEGEPLHVISVIGGVTDAHEVGIRRALAPDYGVSSYSEGRTVSAACCRVKELV
jgi:hypothetical protein